MGREDSEDGSSDLDSDLDSSSQNATVQNEGADVETKERQKAGNSSVIHGKVVSASAENDMDGQDKFGFNKVAENQTLDHGLPPPRPQRTPPTPKQETAVNENIHVGGACEADEDSAGSTDTVELDQEQEQVIARHGSRGNSAASSRASSVTCYSGGSEPDTSGDEVVQCVFGCVCMCVCVCSGGHDSAFVDKRDCECECKCEREYVCVYVHLHMFMVCVCVRESKRERATKSDREFHRRGLTLCSPDIYSSM